MGTTDSWLRQIPNLTHSNIYVHCTYMMLVERRQRVDTTERISRTAERLAKTSADSYKMVIDHVVARQERNVRFAQEMFGGTVREIRHQAESNRALTWELVERAEMQRDAIRTLVGESVDAYTDLLYAPLAYYKQGLRLVESEGQGSRSLATTS